MLFSQLYTKHMFPLLQLFTRRISVQSRQKHKTGCPKHLRSEVEHTPNPHPQRKNKYENGFNNKTS